MFVISANPGNIAKLAIQILNSDGERIDGYASPQVDFIVNPDLTQIAGFPIALTHLTTGVYFYDFQIPVGFSSVGSYLASISWIDQDTFLTRSELFLIQASSAFGNVSASPA